MRAECLLRLDPPDFDVAVSEFEIAIATAKQQQARTFQLRAAIGLSQAWAAKGAHEAGVAPLREIVSAFGDDGGGPLELAAARDILSSEFTA